MSDVTIYHNPRCSKSRETLALLSDRRVEPEIIEYLKGPPDEDTLARILGMLGMDPHDLIRTKEDKYVELGLKAKRDDSKALIRAMVKHPVLIERPIVLKGNAARIGRPPESVLEIL